MPTGLIFHQGTAVSLRRVGDDNGWLPGMVLGGGKRGVHRLDAVAVHADDIPAESRPPLLLTVLLHNVFGIAGNLQAVAVDDSAEVVKLVVAGSHCTLPDGTFGQLTVTHDGVNAVITSIHLACQCHTDADGQAVAERTGVHFDAGQLVVRVAYVGRAKLRKTRLDVVQIQEAAIRQHSVQCLDRMALAQHKAVTVGKTTFEGIFDTPILLCGVMGDAHAALFAQRCIYAGMGKISYGDGASVMINTGFHPVLSDDLSVSLAWGMEKKIQYVLEGNVNYAGALLDWMAANLELAPDREHILALAHQVSDSDGVYLIPAFSGLGAPYWNSSVRTQLSGMTLNTRKCHISCAAEQSIAYQVTDVIRAARAVFSGIKTLRADSSLAQDAPLLQFQSDLLRTPITASAMPESPGAGVAFTAGLTVGLYTPEQLENTCSAKRYEPQMRDTQVAALYAGWCNAVSHMLSQPTT